MQNYLRELPELTFAEDIVLYLDSIGTLLDVEKAAIRYKNDINLCDKSNGYRLSFYFPLTIDVIKLTDISGAFSNFLLSEPHIAEKLIHEVMYCAVITLGEIQDLMPEDVQVPLRVLSLPALPGLIKEKCGKSGLTLLQGILVAKTVATKYMRSTVFKCCKLECWNKRPTRCSVRVSSKPLCLACGSRQEELCRGRDMSDQVFGLIAPSDVLTNSVFAHHRNTLVCFQDELTRNLELGASYSISVCHDSQYFVAWSVQTLQSDIQVKLQHLAGSPVPLPPTIALLHSTLREVCPNSPWTFVAVLASQLAAEFYPDLAFQHLKMGLLLSLATVMEHKVPVPILAVGPDTLAAHRLMHCAAKLAPHYVAPTAFPLSGPLGGVIHQDDSKSWWLEAGPLLLGRPSVCILGDWSKCKSSKLQRMILSVIESGQVVLETQGSTSSGPIPTTPVFPLRSAIWTFKGWSSKEKRSEQAELLTLKDVFGLPYVVDLDEQEAENVSKNILQAAMSRQQTSENAVPFQEIREYLLMVTSGTMQFSENASQLIQSYFVATRRLRSQCLPIGAIKTITALSEAHARLAMNSEVTYEDVVAVLSLYEGSINTFFGQCYVVPPPAYGIINTDLLPLQVHEQMVLFTSWLEKHINSLLTIPEE